jgi:NAD(P)-dependent dehydrogenase (short-subunit alcohol dehydrogenase family)
MTPNSSNTLARFSGKYVVVVGGTSGIGLAIAQAFAKAGARVKATGATDTEVSQAWSHDTTGIDFEELDVQSDSAVKSFFNLQEKLDVLINCAGVIKRGEEHDPETFAKVIDINLNGTMRTCSAALPILTKSRGCIVNTASMLSFFGGSLVPAYSASKGGVAQLTKSLAIAHAKAGVRVNAVAPGWIATPLTKALQEDEERSKPILNRTPMGRWGTPEDIAGPVLFLASSDAEFVTGVILPVDGGYLIN